MMSESGASCWVYGNSTTIIYFLVVVVVVEEIHKLQKSGKSFLFIIYK